MLCAVFNMCYVQFLASVVCSFELVLCAVCSLSARFARRWLASLALHVIAFHVLLPLNNHKSGLGWIIQADIIRKPGQL